MMGESLMKDIADSGFGKYYAPSDLLIIEDQLDNLIGDQSRVRIDGYTAGTQSWDYYTTDRNVYLVRSDTFDNLGSLDKYLMKDGVIDKIYPDANPLYESGKRLRARSYEDRLIYTIIPTKPAYGLVEFKVGAEHWEELRKFLKQIWGEKPNGISIEGLVNYIRGNDYYESWRHGNLRSRCWYWDCGGWKQAAGWQKPIYLSNRPMPTGVPDKEFSIFAKEISHRRKAIILAANNGMVHCFREEDMEEMWAFIPPGYLKELVSYSASKWYQKDLTSRLWLYDLRISELGGMKWRSILIGAYGPTVKGVYALDISKPYEPKWLWEDESVGYYTGQNITYLYQIKQAGYPNKQGGALLIIPSGYFEIPDKFLLLKHPVSGLTINKIDLNIIKGNEGSEIIELYPKINDCWNANQQSNIILFDDKGYLYEINLCDALEAKINFYKPTPDNKQIGLANFQLGKYYNAGLNYLIFSDGRLMQKADIEDNSTHSLYIFGPHNKGYPNDDNDVAKYNFEVVEGNWLAIDGKEKGKNYINIQFANSGERLFKIWQCSSLLESPFIGETVYYPEVECGQKIPHTNFLILPKKNFLLWKNKPWGEIRSEYFNHQLSEPYIDTNNDGLINEADLINGKIIYGKAFNGYVADVRRFRNLEKMIEYLNIIIIGDTPDNEGIYRSELRHLIIKAEPSYEILYKKIIAIPNIKKEGYPSE